MPVVRWFFGLLTVGVIVGGPLGYSAYRNANFRSFRAVEPGVLYRSGQMSQAGLERVLSENGIRTVITLRDPAVSRKEPDWGEEEFCRKLDIKYVRIPPQRWSSSDGGPAPTSPCIEWSSKIGRTSGRSTNCGPAATAISTVRPTYWVTWKGIALVGRCGL